MRNGWRRVAPCLLRRGNEWRADLWFRSQGKVRQLQRTCRTKAEAVAALAELRLQARQKQQRSFTDTSRVSTFGEALDHYLAHVEGRRSESYFRRLKEDLGKVTLAELPERWQRWWQLLRRERRRVYVGRDSKGKPRHTVLDRTLRPGTLNQYLLRSRAALNLCVRHGLTDVNPLARFSLLREIPRDVSMGREDRLRLLNQVESLAPHLGPIVRFASLVPTRKGELVGLRREDVDQVNGVVRLRSGTTKNRDGRYLPIPVELREYFATLPVGCPWAFYRVDWRGEYRPLGDFKRAWRRCVIAAGLQGLRFHDLRAYAATELMLAGNDTRAVMATAGWRTDMLRTYYRRDSLTTARTLKLPGQTLNVQVGCTGPSDRRAENC